MSSRSTLFDLTGWTWIRLAGRDAHKFLHNFCTNDILKLPQTHGCEAFVTNVKARVLGHVFAFEATDETSGRIDVLSFPGQEQPLLAHLDRYLIREDVTLEGRSEETATFLLTGDSSTQLLDTAELSPFQRKNVTITNQTVRCARLDLLGEPGHLATCDRDVADNVRRALCEKGVALGDAATFEARRIAAVLPMYGLDVSEDQLAPEVGRPWAISYAKGCYLGQEPIARIDALGHVNRLLRGVRLAANVVVERGAAIVVDGKEVGTATSAAATPDGQAIALAYLRAKFAAPKTTVAVRTPAGDLPASVFGPAQP